MVVCFPGSGGSLVSLPHAKMVTRQETKNQKMSVVSAEHRDGGGGTRKTDGPSMGKPPVDDRDLGAGRGRKRGGGRTRETAAYAGRRSRVKS